MIKENKEKQREKNGSTASTPTTIKTELSVPSVTAVDTPLKEEVTTETHLNGGDDSDNNCKKNGLRVGTTTASELVGSSTGPAAVATARSSTNTQPTTELCIGEPTPEVKTEETIVQDKPGSCSAVKSELNGNNSHEFTNTAASGSTAPGDTCDPVLPLSMSLANTTGPPPNGVQPLPSNVINKQPGTMDAQYMQQQSQIFVFSTTLANKSAEAVLQGHYPSIIAYHCAQPGTKKYLEKCPLKMNQFNRQNPAQWLNTLAQNKPKTGPGLKGMNALGIPVGGFQGSNVMGDGPGSAMGSWLQGSNNSNLLGNINPVGTGGGPILPGCTGGPIQTTGNIKPTGMDSPCMLAGSPNANSMLHHSPNAPLLGPGDGPQPSLTGVKVPDENLTPQQRQHREEQLATLRKMQQILFPEHQSPIPEGANLGQTPDGVIHGMGPIMAMGPGASPSGGMMPQKNMGIGCMGGPNHITPTSVAAQLEWQKLQHQFYEERKKKGPGSLVLGNSASGLGSPASSSNQQITGGSTMCPRGSGSSTAPRPPPPYHQTTRSASVPTAMSSPNPGSPNNPTSNLSLPSPRAASGLNSPSEPNRQFSISSNNSNSSSRLVGPGPSPTGIHNTSLDSPSASRPLNPSNPSTPMSTHLSPNGSRKDTIQSSNEFSLNQSSNGQALTNQQTPVDGMFCRTLQSLAQQQKQQQQLPSQASKEPNLMPVPSPQQIQYLNTFEGQELTIQKQPNTSLKETNIRSPSIPSGNLEGNLPTGNTELTSSRISGPGTPLTPTSLDINARFSSTGPDLTRFPITSPHTPTTESKSQRFTGPSPQSQGSRTPGMEPPLKTPTTEVGSHFLTTSPQLGDGMGPPRFSSSSSGPSGTSPALSNPATSFLQQTPPTMGSVKVGSHFLDVSPSGSTTAPVDVSPTAPPFLRSENVPLNPNSNSSTPCNGKMAHFDPITSMAQMSQQLTNSVANSPGSQPTGIGSGGPGSAGMLPFSTANIHSMQMNDLNSCQGIPDVQTPANGLTNPMGNNPPGPGGFVNLPLQNVPPHSYSPNSSVGSGMVPCSGSVNTTSCMSQPIVHPNSSSSPKPVSMMMGLGPPRGSSPYSSSPVPQRMMGRPPGPSPYNGANVQVKASAPNTIQYLPAKPQTGNTGPRGPPSLEFLQRFANPLSNLDSKVPTHNLQYFPNGGQNNSVNMSGLNVSMNRPSGLMNSQMGSLGGPSCGGVNGPMMGPNGPLMGMSMPMSSGMVMGPGVMGPLRGGLRPGGLMRMQQLGGGMFGVPSSPNQSVGGDQMFGGGPSQSISGAGPNSQVFVPGSKSSPMGLGGAPDASQPLPPSMGQSNSFKNSPFIGPTTTDPTYAQQFHNFQQQLYATNTRSQMSSQAQPFFLNK